jgi:hypothetical protein
MIALCGEHHAKADGGSFTLDQLREFKRSSYALSAEVKGRFDWRRRDLITRVGGNFYLRTPVMVEIAGHAVVCERRDEDGMLLLSVAMISKTKEPRLVMVDHEWYTIGTPVDFESPPSGRRIHAQYDNGDRLSIQFWDATDADIFIARYSRPDEPVYVADGVQFPVAVAEVEMEVGGTNISFGPEETRAGGVLMRNCWVMDCGIGFSIG